MVFCKQCQRKVEDCAHFVLPIQARKVRVFDEKVESIAYAEGERVLEITFKSGQVWQLSGVPAGVYSEIQNSTISSFLKFIAQRYKASPVKTGLKAIVVPASVQCPVCQTGMTESSRTSSEFDNFIRVFWQCPSCKKSKWETYNGPQTSAPEKEKKVRWH